MSNYNQYYYNGDTINARVVEDGFAVDLRSLATRAKMYDHEYRLGVAKQLNSVYRRKFGHDSGVSDGSLSLEILGHAAGYDFTTSLEGTAMATTSPIANVPIKEAGDWFKGHLEEANVGKNDTFRPIFNAFGEKFH